MINFSDSFINTCKDVENYGFLWILQLDEEHIEELLQRMAIVSEFLSTTDDLLDEFTDMVNLSILIILWENDFKCESDVTDEQIFLCLSNIWVASMCEKCRREDLLEITEEKIKLSRKIEKSFSNITERGNLVISNHSILKQFEEYNSKH